MNPTNNRRNFIKQTAVAGSMAYLPLNLFGSVLNSENRKFRMSLNPGAIGVKLDQDELLEEAPKYGFEAIVPFPSTLADWDQSRIDEYTAKMKSENITWGAAGLPMDFRKDRETHVNGLHELPRYALALHKAGVTRMSTWIMPTHAYLTYLENFKQHSERLREISVILKDHGIRFGLEYVGPKTLMTSQKYAFIHTMNECRELLDSIDEPNTGFQLDSFHWFCAGETKNDILSLSPDQIITCDLNDARAGLTADEQIDGKRELPADTGVIDIKSFLEGLVQIGYDGPVRAEPFNQELNQMDNEPALETTSKALKKAFSMVE